MDLFTAICLIAYVRRICGAARAADVHRSSQIDNLHAKLYACQADSDPTLISHPDLQDLFAIMIAYHIGVTSLMYG